MPVGATVVSVIVIVIVLVIEFVADFQASAVVSLKSCPSWR